LTEYEFPEEVGDSSLTELEDYNISLGIPVFNLQLRTGESDLLLGSVGSRRCLVADVDGVTHDLLMERGESSRVSDQCL
jgi:hypothetical protein